MIVLENLRIIYFKNYKSMFTILFKIINEFSKLFLNNYI